MSYTYCKECGHKNLYDTQVPKFCNGCGTPLGQGASVASLKKTIKRQVQTARKKRTRPVEEIPEDDFDEFSDAGGIPDIADFKCSSSSGGFNRILKLEDLIKIEEGERIEEAPEKRKRGRPKKTK